MFDDPPDFDEVGYLGPLPFPELNELAAAIRSACYTIRPLEGAGVPGLDASGEAWLIIRTVKLPQGFYAASVYFVLDENRGWITCEQVGQAPIDVRRACLFASRKEAGNRLLKIWEDETPRRVEFIA